MFYSWLRFVCSWSCGNLYIEPQWCSPLAAWTALFQIILLSLSIDFGNGPNNRELSPGFSSIDSHNNELIFHHVLNCVSLCSQMPFYPLPKTEWFTDPLLFSSCLWILLFPNKTKFTWDFCPGKDILVYKNTFLSSLLSRSHRAFLT